VTYSRQYSGIFLKGLKRNTQNRSHNSLYPCRGSGQWGMVLGTSHDHILSKLTLYSRRHLWHYRISHRRKLGMSTWNKRANSRECCFTCFLVEIKWPATAGAIWRNRLKWTPATFLHAAAIFVLRRAKFYGTWRSCFYCLSKRRCQYLSLYGVKWHDAWCVMNRKGRGRSVRRVM
jgi:hypothetical protein